MHMRGNTILITGGTSGIGLEIAKRFLALGNTVIVTGRSFEKVEAALNGNPGLRGYVADVSKPHEREALAERAIREFPALNVLFNNAGIQRYPRFDRVENWQTISVELQTNIDAPIHLTMLFSAHFLKQERAAVVNTTSGLSHVPLAFAPVYSATKAALHSLTLSMRHQFAGSTVEVIELSPPKVATGLGGIPGSHDDGMPLTAYVDSAMAGFERGEREITVGFSAVTAQASRAERDALFLQLNGRP